MSFHRIRKALRKKLGDSRGFSFTELLATLLIVAMAAEAVGMGIQAAIRQYNKSMTLSEAKILASTLTSVIQSELGSTGTARLSDDPVEVDGKTVWKLAEFFSHGYANEQEGTYFTAVTVNSEGMRPATDGDGDGYGEILLGKIRGDDTVVGNLLVSSSTYSRYKLKAKVDVTCDVDDNDDPQEITAFHVSLVVHSSLGGETVRTAFDVLPLNPVMVEKGDEES